jgi:hypothetical protein
LGNSSEKRHRGAAGLILGQRLQSQIRLLGKPVNLFTHEFEGFRARSHHRGLQRPIHIRNGLIHLRHRRKGLRPRVHLCLEESVFPLQLLHAERQFTDPLDRETNILS